MSTHIEIERRYVVRSIDPDFRRSPNSEIIQGYFDTPPATSLRVRLLDGKTATVTLKGGQGMSRTEDEHSVSMDLARALLSVCQNQLQKTRYFRDDWEIDEYGGPLTGLIIAEKELDSADESVTLPSWIHDAMEVTNSLTNQHLARLACDMVGIASDKPIRDHLPQRIPRLVLTGGPCSGKSTLMALLRREYGQRVHFVPEVASIVIGQVGIKPPKGDPVETRRFQRVLYRVQRSFEDVSNGQAVRDDKQALLLDRGVIDNAAYLPGGLIDFESVCQTKREYEYTQYDLVVCLETPPREVYDAERTNNPARSETYDAAFELGNQIRNVWRYHPNFHVVSNGASWEEKVEGVRKIVRGFLAK